MQSHDHLSISVGLRWVRDVIVSTINSIHVMVEEGLRFVNVGKALFRFLKIWDLNQLQNINSTESITTATMNQVIVVG